MSASATPAITVSAVNSGSDATFQASFVQLFKALERMDDHDDYDPADLEDVTEENNLEARVERTISDADLTLLNDNTNVSRSIRDLEFTEINDSFRGPGDNEDLFPQVPFGNLSDISTLDDAAVTVSANISNSHYAPGTVGLFLFAERRYLSFVREMDKKYKDFIVYQPTPYPIKKLTLMMYLYWLKVDKNYSFSTIQSTFCYSFLAFLHKTKKDRNIREELSVEIKNTLRALLRKFGNDKFKVQPLMNPDLVKLRLMCDQRTESGSRLDAIMAQGRARGLRSDSFEHVQLQHLSWTKTVVDNRIRLCLEMDIKKDKILLDNVWKQNLIGWVNLGMCPNIALLIYLADGRKVFSTGSAAECLIKNKFILKEGVEEEPLFTPDGKTSVCTNRDISNALKALSLKIGKRYTTRSMRSGLVVTCLLRSRIENNGVFDDRVGDTLASFVHWKNRESLKPYDRYITQYFSAINSLQEPSERFESFRTINQLAQDMGFLEEDSEIRTVEENSKIKDPVILNRLLYHDTTNKTPTQWLHVRKLRAPKYFRLYYRSINHQLDNDMKEDKSSKDRAWSCFWSKACLEEANTDKKCQKLLKDDKKYKKVSSSYRKSVIRKTYGGNSLITKWLVDPKAKEFIKEQERLAFKNKGKLTKTVILDRGTFKRKLSALVKKEEKEHESIKLKFQKLKKELLDEYKECSEDESEEESDLEIILSGNDSE